MFSEGKEVSTVLAIPVIVQIPDLWPDTMATPRAVVSSLVGLTNMMSNMVATTCHILALLARPPDTNNYSGISMSDLTRSCVHAVSDLSDHLPHPLHGGSDYVPGSGVQP